MSAPEVNIPLLRKAVEWVEQEAAKPAIDREWFQGAWVSTPEDLAHELADGLARSVDVYAVSEALEPHCGTAFCLAGYVGQMLDARYAAVDTVDGVHVSDFAAVALGVDHEPGEGERIPLFHSENTAADVRRIAESIAGERL